MGPIRSARGVRAKRRSARTSSLREATQRVVNGRVIENSSLDTAQGVANSTEPPHRNASRRVAILIPGKQFDIHIRVCAISESSEGCDKHRRACMCRSNQNDWRYWRHYGAMKIAQFEGDFSVSSGSCYATDRMDFGSVARLDWRKASRNAATRPATVLDGIKPNRNAKHNFCEFLNTDFTAEKRLIVLGKLIVRNAPLFSCHCSTSSSDVRLPRQEH